MYIRVGVPSATGVFWPDVYMTIESCRRLRDVKTYFEINWGTGQYCLHTARNRSLYGTDRWRDDWEPDFDYFLSMDDDTGITGKDLMKLVMYAADRKNNCIVSAGYPSRHKGTVDRIVAGHFVPETGGHRQMFVSDFNTLTEPIEVDIVGGGAVLIPGEVIRILPKPLWRHDCYECPNGDHIWFCEDQSLCSACRAEKIPVLLAPVPATHRGVSC